MKYIILFFSAIILFVIIAPIGFVFALLPKQNWKHKSQKYLHSIAYTIDQSGNVIAANLFNALLIKSDVVGFGDPDETISSCIGRHKLAKNLTIIGKFLDFILDLIDPGHTVKLIEKQE